MMRILQWLLDLLYPPKCLLCQRLLERGQRDFCPKCLKNGSEYPFGQANPPPKSKNHAPFLDSFTAVWYYESDVRKALHRFKFGGDAYMAEGFGRMLAKRIQPESIEFDVLTWVPVSAQRRRKRGYDQSELLAIAVGKELGTKPVRLLNKIRNNRPQSTLRSAEARKANVLGAYRIAEQGSLQGKRILLIDDIYTTGATSGECARVLKTAGAAEVHCAAVAAAQRRKNKPSG